VMKDVTNAPKSGNQYIAGILRSDEIEKRQQIVIRAEHNCDHSMTICSNPFCYDSWLTDWKLDHGATAGGRVLLARVAARRAMLAFAPDEQSEQSDTDGPRGSLADPDEQDGPDPARDPSDPPTSWVKAPAVPMKAMSLLDVDAPRYDRVAEASIEVLTRLGYSAEDLDTVGVPIEEGVQSLLMEAMLRMPSLRNLLRIAAQTL
jgi:hypothetical protein